MKFKDIKGVKDLRDLDSNDVIDLVDELRGVAQKRGLELLGQSKGQARRALGSPDPGAVPSALFGGIILGLIFGAVAAFLMTPMPGTEARKKLTEQVDKVRDQAMKAASSNGNGGAHYERVSPTTGVTPAPVTGGPTEL